jgi:formate dehydrogenase subunit gamma
MNTVPYDADIASTIIREFDARPELLVQVLHAFLERFGWICEDAVRQLADELNLSRAEVHGVVSYYHDFRTAPPGEHVIKVCAAEACQAMGSRALIAHAQQRLGLQMNESSEALTLEPVYCLGNCACSPAIMVDGLTYGRVTPARFDEIVSGLEGEGG